MFTSKTKCLFALFCFSLCLQSPIRSSLSCWTLCWSSEHNYLRVLQSDRGSSRWPARWQTLFTLSSVLCRFNITSSTKQQNSSMLFVCFILLALVWHVFRGEEQVSAASRMSRHGGLSSDQRQRGSGHIVRFVPQYIYLAELWLGLSLYKCTMCACSETVSCVLNALKCME